MGEANAPGEPSGRGRGLGRAPQRGARPSVLTEREYGGELMDPALVSRHCRAGNQASYVLDFSVS